MNGDDIAFFRQLPKRQTRLRSPERGEFSATWRMLGDHVATRRRVLVWRVPKDNPLRGRVPDGLMRIPFVMRADESIENDDKVLLGVLADLMRSAQDAKPTGGFAITQEVGAFPGWWNG